MLQESSKQTSHLGPLPRELYLILFRFENLAACNFLHDGTVLPSSGLEAVYPRFHFSTTSRNPALRKGIKVVPR
jgi:hypothetical protein